VDELANDLHVTAQTPPTFLYATSDDNVVPVENSVSFYSALHKAGVPAELHVFEHGPHGVGLDAGDPVLGEWPVLLAHWLRARGLLTAR
jgi:acetyl esterase/lipase